MNTALSKKLATTKRSIEYIEGGHNLLDENRKCLIQMIKRIIL